MDKLYIKSRKDSPEVLFDPTTGIYTIVGISHPENVTQFYDPVLRWLDQLKELINKEGSKAVKPIKFRLFFKYVNSASYKYMITLLQVMQEIFDMGVPVEVTWNYEPGDDDMAEAGYELKEYSGIKASFQCEVCSDPI